MKERSGRILRRVARSILNIFLLCALILSATYLCLRGQIGDAPSASEQASYAKLDYYRDGRFQSPKEVVFDFSKAASGQASPARLFLKSRNAPEEPLPKVALDRSSFPDPPADYAVYWLGHSSTILELDGKRLLIDPVFGNAAPLPFMVLRYGEAPIAREELPPVDYIVITHNHYDHLEKKTVRAISSGHFIVPLGVGAALRGWGIEADRITELGWGNSFEEDGLKLTAVEGNHFSGRGVFDRYKTLWASFIVQSGARKIFWSGDTGYGEQFARFGEQYGPFDLAALEIDGWNEGWKQSHMFPQQAVQAALDLGAKRVLPVHWGVFDLAWHPWHESIDLFLEAARSADFTTLTPRMGERIDSKNAPTGRWWR